MPYLCECQLVFPPPSKEFLSPGLWFLHTCAEPSRGPYSTLLSLCHALRPSAPPCDLQLPGSSWILSSVSALRCLPGIPFPGRKLGRQRVHYTGYHLLGARGFSAQCRVSLKLLFYMFYPGLGYFRQETNSNFCYCPLTRKVGEPEVGLPQALPGANRLYLDTLKLSARPTFQLAYFYCSVMSDFWKLEFISCAMRRMQQTVYFLFRNLNISPH